MYVLSIASRLPNVRLTLLPPHSSEEIREARREMWGEYMREDELWGLSPIHPQWSGWNNVSRISTLDRSDPIWP